MGFDTIGINLVVVVVVVVTVFFCLFHMHFSYNGFSNEKGPKI